MPKGAIMAEVMWELEAIRLLPLVLAPNSPIMAVGWVGLALLLFLVSVAVELLDSCLALMEHQLFMAMGVTAAVIPCLGQFHVTMVRAGQVGHILIVDLAVCQGLFISVKQGTLL